LRGHTDRERVEVFIAGLGRRITSVHTVYLAGGASAVMSGWRDSTIDIDLRPEPDSDELLRAVAELKNTLNVNVETASPLDFIPPLPDWREHSPFITKSGHLEVRHMDFRLQALAKLERGTDQDLADVDAMLESGLVGRRQLAAAFEAIRSSLYRFPAIDEKRFARNVASRTR
jgi:hypothetical protein